LLVVAVRQVCQQTLNSAAAAAVLVCERAVEMAVEPMVDVVAASLKLYVERQTRAVDVVVYATGVGIDHSRFGVTAHPGRRWCDRTPGRAGTAVPVVPIVLAIAVVTSDVAQIVLEGLTPRLHGAVAASRVEQLQTGRMDVLNPAGGGEPLQLTAESPVQTSRDPTGRHFIDNSVFGYGLSDSDVDQDRHLSLLGGSSFVGHRLRVSVS
jgi:hypothetical protein